MKGLILSGGKGTRLRPLTYTSAKQLVPVANKPVLFYGIEALVDAGITRHRHRRRRHAGGDPRRGRRRLEVGRDGHLHRAGCAARPRARGARSARRFIGDDPFVMYLGDNLLNRGIVEFVEQFVKREAGGADPADAGARSADVRRRRARRTTRSCGWSRSRRSRSRTWRWSASTCSAPRSSTSVKQHQAELPQRARDHRRHPGPDRSRPARARRTWSTAGGRTPASSKTCSRRTA